MTDGAGVLAEVAREWRRSRFMNILFTICELGHMEKKHRKENRKLNECPAGVLGGIIVFVRCMQLYRSRKIWTSALKIDIC